MRSISRQFTKTTELVKANTVLNVPPYRVGSNQLLFIFNGVICVPGAENQYVEMGEAGTISTEVKIRFDFKPNSEITFIVLPLLEKEGE